jgi:hypothetical protein
VPTFVGRGVSRGQRGGSPTAVNLSFLDRNKDIQETEMGHAVAQVAKALCYKQKGHVSSNLPNRSSSAIGLGFTKPLTEMMMRNCFWQQSAAGSQGWPHRHL